MNPFLLFAALMVGHVVSDYPLQGDFLARAKNHKAPIPGFPWYQALGAHALIHGGSVWLITGIWWLGAAEMIAHAMIDWLKCEGCIGLNTDQAMHATCKGVWAYVIWAAL